MIRNLYERIKGPGRYDLLEMITKDDIKSIKKRYSIIRSVLNNLEMNLESSNRVTKVSAIFMTECLMERLDQFMHESKQISDQCSDGIFEFKDMDSIKRFMAENP